MAWCLVEAKALGVALDGNTRTLHVILKSMQPWRPKRDVRLFDETGFPSPGYVKERRLVAKLFADFFEAAEIDFCEIIHDERAEAVNEVEASFEYRSGFAVRPDSSGCHSKSC